DIIFNPGTQTPDFILSASPGALSVAQGSSGSSTISTAAAGGFNSAISLSVSGLPAGVTASLTPTSIAAPGNGNSTLNFTASSTASTGTFNVTVTASGGGITHTATIALSVTAAAGTGSTTTQVLGNPGFENGSTNPAPWSVSAGVINNSASEPPHGGAWDAWLDGYGTTHTDTLMQQVSIPSNATAAALSFWLHIDTAETTTTSAFDTLAVQVRNASGTVLSTLKTFSNLNKNTGFAQQSFDLTSFKGQTIQINLVGTEDASLQTSFVMDDFALNVTTPSSTDTTPPTATVTAPANGATISGTVTVSASASDNTGVTQMQLLIDGTLVASNTSATALSFSWSTPSVANGSHTIVAKAVDAAGNVGTSSTVTVTVSNGTPTTTELILNGGFENGTSTSPWTLSTGVINNSTAEPAHTGSWDAWLDGYGTTHTDTAMQQVTIPSTATAATFSFWLHVDTAETTTSTAFDKLTVQVRDSTGKVLSTLATFSNLNHAAGYQQQSFDLTAFRGQIVQIFFSGTEDTQLQTSFVLDDVSLKVTQ
ncbi:MAG TPA: Ig-like domain-containing protein, partial [Candidatus Limnocylindrales bacterium]|nr:Ig-like domain-containing protein [Candidatus Limnocylindrales bacterium]